MQTQSLNNSYVYTMYGTENNNTNRTQNFRGIEEIENNEERYIRRDNKQINEDEMNKKWSEEEIGILNNNFNANTSKELIRLLPKRTWRSISTKANRSGLEKSKYFLSNYQRFNHINNEKIRELREEGLTSVEIAKKLDCSVELIKKRYKEIGIKGLSRKEFAFLKLDNQLIKKLYNDGISIAKISKKLKCSQTAINSRLVNMGIKRVCKNRLKLKAEEIDNIIKLYKEGNSIYEIEKLIGIHNQRVFQYLKKKGINLRNISEANNLLWRKDDGTRRDKLRKINKDRYSDPKFLKIYKESINRKPNRPEQILINLIKDNDLPFNYVGDGEVWIGGFNPDFLSKNPKHIIEIYGDYWHANTKIYSDLTQSQLKQKDKDKRRLESYSKLGYKTLIIWESELNNLNIILNKIRSFVNE